MLHVTAPVLLHVALPLAPRPGWRRDEAHGRRVAQGREGNLWLRECVAFRVNLHWFHCTHSTHIQNLWENLTDSSKAGTFIQRKKTIWLFEKWVESKDVSYMKACQDRGRRTEEGARRQKLRREMCCSSQANTAVHEGIAEMKTDKWEKSNTCSRNTAVLDFGHSKNRLVDFYCILFYFRKLLSFLK